LGVYILLLEARSRYKRKLGIRFSDQ